MFDYEIYRPGVGSIRLLAQPRRKQMGAVEPGSNFMHLACNAYVANRVRRFVRVAAISLGCSVAATVDAEATPQSTALVSMAAGGGYSNGNSLVSSISSNRRCIAFDSGSSDLVQQDTNFARDVFVRDFQFGVTERVSVSSTGVQGNHHSRVPVISGDGRYVAFRSLASNLVSGDTNGREDVFFRDRAAGATVRISVSSAGLQSNQDCIGPAISEDGRYVAFESAASNLVSGDFNGVSDVFVRDVLNNQTFAISLDQQGAPGNMASRYASFSADARYVAFQSSASNLVPGDTNGVADIFVRDLWSGTTERVSLTSTRLEANAACTAPSISGNGRFVSFESLATNLVPGDTNGFQDIFVRDLHVGTTVRVSVSSTGIQGDNYSGADCCVAFTSSPMSHDGRVIAFVSAASNLAGVDIDNFFYWDVFTHDLLTGVTTRASINNAGLDSWLDCRNVAMSADGRWVTFQSADATLVPPDTNNWEDVFLRDLGPSPFVIHCSGDGTSGACPCGNAGSTGRGCQNSRGTGGGELTAAGVAELSADSLSFSFTGGSSATLVILFQGSDGEAATPFGDGLRCVGGLIKRIQARTAAGGFALFPEAGEPSISVRSAIVGDPIPIGATRHYQAYYRDANPGFCPAGGTANSSQAVAVLWEP